jgi:hypothetical protein
MGGKGANFGRRFAFSKGRSCYTMK